MTHPHRPDPAPWLAAAALLVPAATSVGVCAAAFGGPAGIAAAAGAAAALANLAVLRWLTGMLDTDRAHLASLGLGLKFLVALTVFGALLALFDPIGVAIGLTGALVGACIRGLLPTTPSEPAGYASGPAVVQENR